MTDRHVRLHPQMLTTYASMVHSLQGEGDSSLGYHTCRKIQPLAKLALKTVDVTHKKLVRHTSRCTTHDDAPNTLVDALEATRTDATLRRLQARLHRVNGKEE